MVLVLWYAGQRRLLPKGLEKIFQILKSLSGSKKT
jgi:hypothetical protein